MRDPRVDKLANLLVTYCLDVQAGEWVHLRGEAISLPLLGALGSGVLAAGGLPHVDVILQEMERSLLNKGAPAQLAYTSPVHDLLARQRAASVFVFGSENTRALGLVDAERQNARAVSLRPLTELAMRRFQDPHDPYRFANVLYPTQAHAQDAGMSLAEFEDFVYGACMPDADYPSRYWRHKAAEQQRLLDWLAGRQQIHVRGPNIDLRFSVAGRTWLQDDGHLNLPGGEIFTGPREDDVDGLVRFSYPAIYKGDQGPEVTDVQLWFEGGQVVRASAAKNESYLLRMLDLDDGARRLGEFAIGTNDGVTRFIGHPLFDEKIAGTCHLAVGFSIPGTGGVNRSAIHWDMVCDLRTDSRITADGDLFYADGQFVLPGA